MVNSIIYFNTFINCSSYYRVVVVVHARWLQNLACYKVMGHESRANWANVTAPVPSFLVAVQRDSTRARTKGLQTRLLGPMCLQESSNEQGFAVKRSGQGLRDSQIEAPHQNHGIISIDNQMTKPENSDCSLQLRLVEARPACSSK